MDDDVKSLISMLDISPVKTCGIRQDMKKILEVVDDCEDFADDWKYEVRPSVWGKDKQLELELYNLSHIAGGVKQRLKEIKAILIAGLGEENREE